MAQEVGLLAALAPELDGVRQGVHGLRVAPDKGAPEVDVRQAVDLRLQVGDLPDVVADGVEEGARHVGVGEGRGGAVVVVVVVVGFISVGRR